MAKKAKTKKWVATKQWKALSKEQQIEEVREAMAVPGTSNKSAATKLGATPGMVAGIRFKNNIPSTNKPGDAPKIKAAEVAEPPSVVPVKVPDVVEEAPPLPTPQGATKPKPNLPPLKLAPTEAVQCHHIFDDSRRCGGLQEPGSRYCDRHQ